MADWISLLSKKNVNSENGLRWQIEVDLKRGRDFQSLANLVYCCSSIPNPRMPSAQKIEQWIRDASEPEQEFKSAVEDVLRTFWYLASQERYNKGFTDIEQRVAPVEFVFIGAFCVAYVYEWF